ncbi:MAG: glycerate kinase, partial [Phycisphaerales bacterium]|nr:glycerate kinase [Phycisphaerales bacterium]
MTASEAARAMAAAITAAEPAWSVDACPVGDGGEGTLEAIVEAAGGRYEHVPVIGPDGSTLTARLGWLAAGSTAFVELAEASGLTRLSNPPDPTRTTTYGTGQLIAAAAAARTIIVGLGGSATCDGGVGMTQALGGRFEVDDGRTLTTPITGGALERLTRVELPTLASRVRVACDVTNPLLGPDGAAAVYGPQKGATPAQVIQLERGLAHLATLLGGDRDQPGAGAAGGVGFMLATLGATLERGIDLVLDLVEFPARVAAADLVITGEGRLDATSLNGKACVGVAHAAANAGVPTIAIAGVVDA